MSDLIKIPEAFSDLFTPKRYKAYYGGRGSAKSHSLAAALLIKGCQEPLRILCGREIQKSIRESVKQLLDDKIKALGLTEFYESLRDEIRGKTGTQFSFQGIGDKTAEQLKSFEGVDIFWGEEAQTFSAHSLEILRPTIRKAGSELWFSWNPRSASDPIDMFFRGPAPPENSIIKRVNYDANRFFPKELEEERQYDLKHKPDRYGHIWLGEYEPTVVGAIWDRLSIHQNRRTEAPTLSRILVAVDPAVSAEEHSDEHGIIACGIGEDSRGYVLEDASLKGSPRQWAERAIATFDRFEADAVVVEINQGGDMVKHTLQSIRPGLPIIEVRASRGKHVRAEPVAALYSLGRVSHIGAFPKLEDQMCQMTAAGYEGEGSPDRVDALVWGLTELFPQMITPKAPKVSFVEPLGSGSWMA